MEAKEFAKEFIEIMNKMFETYDYIEDIPISTISAVFDSSEKLAEYILKG